MQPGVLGAIGRAFAEERRVEIAYADREGRRTERTVESHGLLITSPLWYVLAYDSLREAPRTFRLDRN